MLEKYHGVLLYETIYSSILMKGQPQTDAIFLNCFISNKQLFVMETKPGMPDSGYNKYFTLKLLKTGCN